MSLDIYDKEQKQLMLDMIKSCRNKVSALEAALVKCKKVSDVEKICYEYDDNNDLEVKA